MQKLKSQMNSSTEKYKVVYKPQPEIRDPEIFRFLKRKRFRPKPMKALPITKDPIFIDFLKHKKKINLFLSQNARSKSFNVSMSPTHKRSLFGQTPVENVKKNKEKKREKEQTPIFKYEELINIINEEDKEQIFENEEEDVAKMYWKLRVS
jgi:hypothetical protein